MPLPRSPKTPDLFSRRRLPCFFVSLVAMFLLLPLPWADEQRFSPSACAAEQVASQIPAGDLQRLDGPLLFSSRGVSDLKSLPISEGVQFGGFRSNDHDPPNEQFVKHWLKSVDTSSSKTEQFLVVYYNVTKPESFCGFWLKVGGGNWTRYIDGDLVLRLRQFAPLNEVAIFDERRRPVSDTGCTDTFKLELKAITSEGEEESFSLRKYVRYPEKDQQKKLGYFDLRIPLRDFGLDKHLTNVVELAITFEDRAIPASHQRGNLGIQSVALTEKRGAGVGNLGLAQLAIAPVDPARITPRATKGHLVVESPGKDHLPLAGPTVLRFASSASSVQIIPSTERNAIVPKSQFGIFRDEDPRRVQFIEERWTSIDLPHRAQPTGFLRLKYEVPSRWNGWWLKLAGADWRRFKDGFLVLGLRPGPNCTPVFKLELKTQDGAIPYYVYLRISEKDLQTVEQLGYVPLAVPLSEFGIRDFSRMAELVIVFESNRIPSQNTNGELLLESIRLIHDRQELDAFTRPSLLDDMARLGFQWFQDNRHPTTGMVLDRSPNRPVRGERPRMSSIASTGYHLSLLPEWVRLELLTREEAGHQAAQALEFAEAKLAQHKGLFYHFVDWETGQRWESTEVSCLDSAILLNGSIVSGEFFKGRIKEAADKLVDRAEWDAFLVKHPRTGMELLSLGWTPEKGLLGPADVRSSEMAMPYFLAVGSRTHPIDPQCWYDTDVLYGEVSGIKILNRNHPLFTSLYGLGWHDLKGKRDRDGVDLFANARAAALANRAFCREYSGRSRSYTMASGGWWGISAGDSPDGYVAAAPVFGDPDGTVWPLAALATVPWIPEEIEADLTAWRRSELWHDVCGTYGLSPFNLDRKGARTGTYWRGDDLIGIDVGSFCVSLANARNRTVWKSWMEHEVAHRALTRLSVTGAPAGGTNP